MNVIFDEHILILRAIELWRRPSCYSITLYGILLVVLGIIKIILISITKYGLNLNEVCFVMCGTNA